MWIAALTFAQLLRHCAPSVDPATMTAIVRVESGGNALAMHDNTLGQAYFPASTQQAVAWGQALSAEGHSLDFGLSQVNSVNLPRLGLNVARIFDPCTNLAAGSTILSEDYLAASGRFGAGQYALRRALGAYNTGSLFAGQDYVNEILAAAGMPAEDAYGLAHTAVAAAPAAHAHAANRKRHRTSTDTPVDAAPRPAYDLEHTSGSPVVVIVGR